MRPNRVSLAVLLPVLCSAVLLSLSISGCFEEDYHTIVDSKVTEEWMRHGQRFEAMEFFEKGGKYFLFNEQPAGGKDLNKEGIMPFLEAARKEFGTEQYAIVLEEENGAWGIVMRMPDIPDAEDKVREFVEKSQATFPGMILTEWGHKWVSFDFRDEDGAEVIRRARQRTAS